MFRARHSPFDLRNEFLRQLSQANQKHVAITKSYAIMMVIRLSNLPQDTTVPINLKRGTAFPWLPADKAF